MTVDGMRFASALTTEGEVEDALRDLVGQIRAHQSNPGSFDLAVVFMSAHFMHAGGQIAAGLRSALQPGVLLGCTAEGVIGREQEIEGGAAIALVAARLPRVDFTPFILQTEEWPLLLLDTEAFRRAVDAPDETKLILALADPFSSPMEDVLQAFNASYPGIPMAGGMASGALRPNGNVLLLGDQVLDSGVIGVALSGSFEADIVVSQGCRPIWRPFKVNAAHRNVIFDLEGQPPLVRIRELVPELSDEDKALLQGGLFVGRAIDPQQEVLGRGDFLIRGVVGIDQENGAIAIADSIQEGETIQFHIRDAVTAKEDFEMMLVPQMFRDPPEGALLFSCNGRGTRLYDHPNGDISVLRQNLGDLHLAGFFCAGEIGPVAGRNFLHGHTASLVLFRSG